MSANAAVEMLMDEHKVIMTVVEGLKGVAASLRSGGRVDPQLLADAVRFMTEFADRCHHAKEEDLLFPALIAHGAPPHGCPIDALLHEHQKGRTLVAAIAGSIDAYAGGADAAAEAICAAIDEIRILYANHIWKEDEMAFPLVERLIPARDREELYASFLAVEAANPPGAHAAFHQIARRIADAADRDEVVDEASRESFPASDPPAWVAHRGEG